jgi:hypothetical protein
MKTLILKGGPAKGRQSLDTYLNNLEQKLVQNAQPAETLNLAEMNIHYCTGCWSCWVKTPGRCLFRDDMEKVYAKIIAADLLLLASPLVLGFVHSSLKKTMDRMIPLILPYIGIYQGECHHYLRYPKIPDLAVLVTKEPDTDDIDLEIVAHTFQRLSLNFRNRLIFSRTTDTPWEVVFDEINHI